MLGSFIKTQKDFSNKFIAKAKINDIVFLLYCIIYPFFLPYVIYSMILLSYVALFYMNGVINLPVIKEVEGRLCLYL